MTKEASALVLVIGVVLSILIAVVSAGIRATEAKRALKRDLEYEVHQDPISLYGCNLRITSEGALTITDLDRWNHTLWPPYKFRQTGEKCSELLEEGGEDK